MQYKTRSIAGIEVSLVPGRQYLAESPIATGIVKVVDMATGAEAARFDLSYKARCRFLNAFNNGRTSFSGRSW